MSNFSTEFFFEIENVTIAEYIWLMDAAWVESAEALDAEAKLRGLGIEGVEEVEQWPAVDLRFYKKTSRVVLADRGGYLDIQHVDILLQAFIRRFRPDAVFGYEYANTCAMPQVDGFGGGASLVSAHETKYMSTSLWIEQEAASMLDKNKKR